jgi:aminopeptidase
MYQEMINQASINITDILTHSFHINKENILIIYDDQFELTNILYKSYLKALKSFKNINSIKHININLINKDQFIELINLMNERDLVVLIQSSNFRLNVFRIRLHLFNKKLKVIEHVRLSRNSPDQFQTYINSLSYNDERRAYYNDMKNEIDNLIESPLQIIYNDAILETGPLEKPKYNLGNYDNNINIGGTFPIGEIFTEAKELDSLKGSLYIYAFANKSFEIVFCNPFKIYIEKGIIIQYEDAPQEFKEVIEMVSIEEKPIIREIGFGLNEAISISNKLNDITAFERVKGLHFSIGYKHSVYKKVNIKADKAKYHIDIFACGWI